MSETPPDVPPHLADAPLPLPAGTVVTGTNALPLAGVLVRWSTVGDRDGPGVELGRAVTDPDGAFLVVPGTAPPSRAAQCAVRWSEEPRTVLLVGHHTHEVGDGSTDTPLVITVPEADGTPGDDTWARLAEHLSATGVLTVEGTVDHLLDPPPDSPVARWEPEVRGGVADQVTTALRAVGAAGVGDSRLVDLAALGAGDVTRAVTTFGDLAASLAGRGIEVSGTGIGAAGGSGTGGLGGIGELFPDVVGRRSELERYRDYLRGVWVTAATDMYSANLVGQTHLVPTETALVDQLDRRFHQSFRTRDTGARPVAELLVPILLEALTTPVVHGGWGMPTYPDRAGASDAEYLAALVAATGVDAAELRNRFRVRFDRPGSESASAVELNVEALLGLLADTWQSPLEPFTTPLRGLEPYRPFLVPPRAGRAPFYLQLEEWAQRQRPFFPENVYDVRRSLPDYEQQFRDRLTAATTENRQSFSDNGYFSSTQDYQQSAAWVLRLVAAVDGLRAALTLADKQNHRGARAGLEAQRDALLALAKDYRAGWRRTEFLWWSGFSWNPPAERRVSTEARAARRVRTEAELGPVEAWFDQTTAYHGFTGAELGVARMRTLGYHHLEYLLTVAVPWLLAEVHVALGDPARALDQLAPLTRFPVHLAEVSDPPGYGTAGGGTAGTNRPGRVRNLSHTTVTSPDPTKPGHYADVDGSAGGLVEVAVDRWFAQHVPAWERRAVRLAQGDIMLELADRVFRREDPASVRRARELAKGVMLMHGVNPGTVPRWNGEVGHGLLGHGLPLELTRGNPVVESQLVRARRMLMLIEAGLNAYGYHPDMVPALRFEQHEGAARSFATSAKAAQADLIAWTTRFEQAQIEQWHTAAMVARGEAAVTIARERTEIAKAGVAEAEKQVKAVEAQILAKQKEIEEESSLVNQFTGFLGGVKDSMTGLVSSAQTLEDAGGSAQTAAAAKAGAAKGIGGTAGAKDAALAKLGPAFGPALAFGAFAYAGISGIVSLGEQMRRRDAQLTALRETALPAAQDAVRLARRDVTIGEAEALVAGADLELAHTLARFAQERFLSVGLWNHLSRFAERTLRRYVDLAGRHAWLAERALEYEQLRAVRVVKLDYHPVALRGLTGPDQLLLDLAELESDRLLHVRGRVPVKHTVSLAREFPLAFGQLRSTGRCTFRTSEDDLRRTYPGLWGLRVVSVGVRTDGPSDGPARGVLRNLGVSTVSRPDGTADVVVRFPDVLAVSELQLPADALLHRIPGDTLLAFEGSGVTTDWELELPTVAGGGNLRGLGHLTDVLVTLDLRAHHGNDVSLPEPTGPVHRALLLAASTWDPVGLGSLTVTGGSPARIAFDLRALGLPRDEAGRTLSNVALVGIGRAPSAVPVTVRAQVPAPLAVATVLEDGIALSTGGPLAAGVPAPTPLTELVGLPADQVITVEIAASDLTDDVRALNDVVLFVEVTSAPE